MPDVREEFEAWVTAAMGGYADLRKSTDPNFDYDDGDVDFAYQAWQASRAALRVELPDREFPHHSDVVEALQQAGIEVK
ncbi:hypothetical protein [Pseudomonas sp.]|uniref:hypothetical protein n=1 Tax=Pseudomonas sp. TaxID=306 RepID=UPI0029103DEE|nr:hypothetical protein [Pseudomonas sp.]MDU4249071.1 hypothetical protein [Pseudomonas sp.]